MSILRTENLTKSFGENIILQNVTVEIQKGEVVSIIGPSGTGKSTFLRAVNFLLIISKNIDGFAVKWGWCSRILGFFTWM